MCIRDSIAAFKAAQAKSKGAQAKSTQEDAFCKRGMHDEIIAKLKNGGTQNINPQNNSIKLLILLNYLDTIDTSTTLNPEDIDTLIGYLLDCFNEANPTYFNMVFKEPPQ